MSLSLGLTSCFEEEIEKDFVCYVCDRTFSRLGFLKAHFQRTHPDSKFPSSLLNNHSSNEPTSRKKPVMFTNKIESSHVCEKCNKSFAKKIDLLKHVFVHRQFPVSMPAVSKCKILMQCDTCKKPFHTQPDYRKHYVRCELCSCRHCGAWLYQKEFCKKDKECQMCKRELCVDCHTLHQNCEIVEETFECVVCNKMFPSKKTMKDHYAESHSIAKLAY